MKELIINILPHGDNGATYKGILTFTATERVNVGIGHRLPVYKDILSQNRSQELRSWTQLPIITRVVIWKTLVL